MSVTPKPRGVSCHTIEEKIEVVRQRIFQESSFQDLQDRYGICSSTLSVWITKYKAEVLRRFPVKDLPLYVLKYQETMTKEEEDELTRLRRENEDLKLLHEANLLMIDMAKERFGIDVKKLRGDVIHRVLEGSGPRKGQQRVALLCGHFGYSKQAYYRGQHSGDKLERECYLLSLVRDIRKDMPNQVWVSDITYVDTLSGFVFLSLVTDAYSRRIVGWFVHDRLNTEGPLNALYRAFLQVGASEIEGTIHHSDRGVQYCSYQYNATLGMKRMNTSMTQDGSPYDNAIAERVNGILKREWLEREVFENIEQVRERVEKVVGLYNGQRPHFSIGLNTPDSVYRDLTGKFAFNMY